MGSRQAVIGTYYKEFGASKAVRRVDKIEGGRVHFIEWHKRRPEGRRGKTKPETFERWGSEITEERACDLIPGLADIPVVEETAIRRKRRVNGREADVMAYVLRRATDDELLLELERRGFDVQN